jgi:hypothetical protein
VISESLGKILPELVQLVGGASGELRAEEL